MRHRVHWWLLGLAACAGAPTAVTPPPPPAPPSAPVLPYTAILFDHGTGQFTLQRGEQLTIGVLGLTPAGVLKPIPSELLKWESSEPDVAVTGPGFVLAGTLPGYSRVTVRAGSLLDSVWIHVPDAEPPRYPITFYYAPDVPQRYKDALAVAAARWQEVIRDTVPGYLLTPGVGDCPVPAGEPLPPPQSGIEHGVRVYVGMSGKYPPGTYVEATGGPCLNRPLPSPTVVLGVISINRDKDPAAIPAGRMRYLAHHELGHVLGLVGVVQRTTLPFWNQVTNEYTGTYALAGFARDFPGRVFSFADNGSHWLWGGDLMSARDAVLITHASVGALRDLGFTTKWEGAGPY